MLMSAKKKSPSSKKSKLPRKEDVTQHDLESDLASLEEAIGELKVFAAKSFANISTLSIDGAQKIHRAKVLVREYADNLWREARREEDRRGRLS